VWFDVSFLQQLFVRAGTKWPFRHRFVDVQSVVSFHMKLAAVAQAAASSGSSAKSKRTGLSLTPGRLLSFCGSMPIVGCNLNGSKGRR